MTTAPVPDTPQDAVVSLLSHWLARHVGADELRDGLAAIGTGGLRRDQAAAVDELLADIDELRAAPGELERLVRETLEAVALG